MPRWLTEHSKRAAPSTLRAVTDDARRNGGPLERDGDTVRSPIAIRVEVGDDDAVNDFFDNLRATELRNSFCGQRVDREQQIGLGDGRAKFAIELRPQSGTCDGRRADVSDRGVELAVRRDLRAYREGRERRPRRPSPHRDEPVNRQRERVQRPRRSAPSRPATPGASKGCAAADGGVVCAKTGAPASRSSRTSWT